MNTKGIRFLAVLAVMVMAFAAIAIVAPAADDSEGMGTSTTSYVPPTPIQYQEQKVSGVAIDNIVYQSNQKIIINEGETWEIGDDYTQICVVIMGELEIPEGSTVLIKAGSTLLISGNMIVNGTILAEEKQSLMTKVKEGDTEKVVEYKVAAGAVVDQFTDYDPLTPAYDSTGTVQLEMPGFLEITGTASISNSIDFDGWLEVYNGGKVEITDGAELTMGTESYLMVYEMVGYTEGDTVFVVDEGSTLTIEGYFGAYFTRNVIGASTDTYEAGIDNCGTITIDSDKHLIGNVVINQAMDGASIFIESVVFADIGFVPTLTVTDMGLVLYEQIDGSNVKFWYVDDSNCNTFKLDFTVTGKGIVADNEITVTGLAFAEDVTFKDVKTAPEAGTEDAKGYIGIGTDFKRVYTNTMLIAGDVTSDAQYVGKDSEKTATEAVLNMTLTAKRQAAVIEDTELALNSYTALTIASGSIFKIAGTVDVTSNDAKATNPSMKNDAKIIMEGTGVLDYYNGQFDEKGTLTAAKIVLEKNKVSRLLTIDAALATDMSAFDVKTITLMGASTITASATLASGVELNVSTFELSVGTAAGVELTIEDGAKVKAGTGGKITVNGTMYAENASNVTVQDIVSDVKSEELNEKGAVVKKGWVLWDNLKNALDNAVAGSMITVTTNNLSINTNITIPELVTLNIPSTTTTITVKKGTEAAPTTITVNGYLVIGTALTTPGTWGTHAKIVVNGFFLTTDADVETDTYKAAGAFYVDNTTSKLMITTLANAVASEAKAIKVYGTVAERSAVEASAEQTVTLAVNAALSVSDLTIAKEIDASATGAKLTGKISSEKGVLQLSKYNGKVTATKGVLNFDKIDGNITVASGNVKTSATTTVDKSVLTVSSGATLSISAALTLSETAYLAGTVEITNSLTINPAKPTDITFTGSIVVKKAGTLALSVDKFRVLGSIVAENGSTFNVNNDIYVGTQPTSVGATASISGDVTTLATSAFIIVFPGADVSGMTIMADADGASTGKMTKFILNGTEIATVYVAENTEVPVSDIIGKIGDDGKIETGAIDFTKINGIDSSDLYDPATWGFETGQKIGDIEAATATAPAAQITIRTSHAIGASLFVDGVRIQGEHYTLAVGTHTLSGSIDPGYEGSIVFTYKGVTIQGGQFTVAVGDDDAVLALTGDIHAVEPEVPEDKSGEITITEILLIVLVILIAVMCVVLILRLNRS